MKGPDNPGFHSSQGLHYKISLINSYKEGSNQWKHLGDVWLSSESVQLRAIYRLHYCQLFHTNATAYKAEGRDADKPCKEQINDIQAACMKVATNLQLGRQTLHQCTSILIDPFLNKMILFTKNI